MGKPENKRSGPHVGSIAGELIRVQVSSPYGVTVGANILPSLPGLVTEQRVMLITDTNLARLYGDLLEASFAAAGKQLLLGTIPAGESSKNGALFLALLDQLAANALGRDCAVVGFGGGVVTDLAGFVAASWLRGVAYYSVPTSLLGMVDAGVGGKTGINLPAGKNLIGAFWQPRHVLIDVTLLASLPAREFRLGAVEFFKHGLISDTSLLKLLGNPGFSGSGEPAQLVSWLAAGINVKAQIVSADEREHGVRAWLNYGHTLAHALEGATRHELAHGEAVAYGILFAALLGRERNLTDVTSFALRLLKYVQPQPLPELDFEQLLAFMQRDKKNTSGTQRFVLLERPGRPVVVADVSLQEQQRAWQQLRELLDHQQTVTATTPAGGLEET